MFLMSAGTAVKMDNAGNIKLAVICTASCRYCEVVVQSTTGGKALFTNYNTYQKYDQERATVIIQRLFC